VTDQVKIEARDYRKRKKKKKKRRKRKEKGKRGKNWAKQWNLQNKLFF
jgi:hypothetical protein